MFDVPTISVNFSSQKFSKILDASELLFETDLKGLTSTINSIMSGTFDTQHYREARKNFIKEHYNIPVQEPEKLIKGIIEST